MPSWADAPLVAPGGGGMEEAPLVEEAPAPRATRAPRASAAGATKPLTEQRAKYSLFSVARYDLDELQDILSSGGPPSYTDAALQGMAGPTGVVGPIAGSMQSGRAKRYYAAAGRLSDSIEKAYTGAQSTEIEHLRYIASNIPAFYDDPTTVKSKLLGIRRRLNALDLLAHGETPNLEDIEGPSASTPAPTGQMGPPPAAQPAPTPAKKRLKYNPATGNLE